MRSSVSIPPRIPEERWPGFLPPEFWRLRLDEGRFWVWLVRDTQETPHTVTAVVKAPLAAGRVVLGEAGGAGGPPGCPQEQSEFLF